jgi:hypothetical protein
VFARLLFVAVIWLTALMSLAALVQWSGLPPSPLGSNRDGVTALARALNQLRPTSAHGEHTWTVTSARSAARALVVEVDAINPGAALQIAEQLLAGVRSRYDEVLVYVSALDPTRDPVVRRIEWTRRRGYLASTF